MKLVLFAELYVYIQWLKVKFLQFWPCIFLLTAMPSTNFEIIYFCYWSYFFHLFSLLKMYACSFLIELLKQEIFSCFQFQNKIEVGLVKDIFRFK